MGEPDDFADLNLQHCQYTVAGSTLNVSDTEGYQPMGSSFTEYSWNEHTVTADIASDVDDSRSYSQYLFFRSMGSDMDSIADQSHWTMGDSGTNRPELVVEYSH